MTLEGANSLVGSPFADTDSPFDGEAAPNRKGRGFSDFLPGRRDVVTDGSEWIVGAIVLGSLAFLILLRKGGFQSIIAAR